MEWEERWWEASDWAGYKEMGAEKSGCTASGEAWRETWREVISVDGDSGEPTVERSAHKWAHTETVCSNTHCSTLDDYTILPVHTFFPGQVQGVQVDSVLELFVALVCAKPLPGVAARCRPTRWNGKCLKS